MSWRWDSKVLRDECRIVVSRRAGICLGLYGGHRPCIGATRCNTWPADIARYQSRNLLGLLRISYAAGFGHGLARIRCPAAIVQFVLIPVHNSACDTRGMTNVIANAALLAYPPAIPAQGEGGSAHSSKRMVAKLLERNETGGRVPSIRRARAKACPAVVPTEQAKGPGAERRGLCQIRLF